MSDSVYQIVTQKVCEQLEKGIIPWHKSWASDGAPKNLISQKEYRGINPFLLSTLGYASPYFLSFKQANNLGGRIRKGEKGALVVFWQVGQEKLVTLDDGTKRKQKPFLLRYYTVFNLQQTEGIADKLGLDKPKHSHPRIDVCEKLVESYSDRPTIHNASAAYYRPSNDTIGMPCLGSFDSAESYYAVLFHELSHSTGSANRLNREGIQSPRFGSEPYAKEELVAEMASAFLCGLSGISPQVIDNSASYLANWLTRLKKDSKLLVSAASHAQRAVDYIRKNHDQAEAEESETIPEREAA